jgi:hypothetical protein
LRMIPCNSLPILTCCPKELLRIRAKTDRVRKKQIKQGIEQDVQVEKRQEIRSDNESIDRDDRCRI